MTFLIQQTLIYAVPLMIVALAGVFAERSGIINLALEGIMIFGAFAGVLFVNVTQKAGIFSEAKAAGDWVALQGFMLLAMLVAAILGAVFSLLLSFASVNLKADQTIGGTALNLMAPALVLFFIRIIAHDLQAFPLSALYAFHQCFDCNLICAIYTLQIRMFFQHVIKHLFFGNTFRINLCFFRERCACRFSA